MENMKIQIWDAIIANLYMREERKSPREPGAEKAKRIAIFFFAIFSGTAFSPLLASAILKLDGIGGICGWRWIFMSEYSPMPDHRT